MLALVVVTLTPCALLRSAGGPATLRDEHAHVLRRLAVDSANFKNLAQPCDASTQYLDISSLQCVTCDTGPVSYTHLTLPTTPYV